VLLKSKVNAEKESVKKLKDKKLLLMLKDTL